MPALGRSSIREHMSSLALLLDSAGAGVGVVGAVVVCSVMAVMDMTPVLVLRVLALLVLLLLLLWSFTTFVVGPVSKPPMKDSETPSLKTVAKRGSPKTQLLQSWRPANVSCRSALSDADAGADCGAAMLWLLSTVTNAFVSSAMSTTTSLGTLTSFSKWANRLKCLRIGE